MIEFKYVRPDEINIHGEQLRKADLHSLQRIPRMQREMKAAQQQATDYGDAHQRKYHDLRLKRFAVVAIGFERLWWEAVG